MFASLARAISNFFDGTLKGVILKSIGLTILLFILSLVGLEIAIAHLPALGAPWVNSLIEVLAPILFFVAIFAFGAPVAAVFASFFLDRVARTIEARAYSGQPAAPSLPVARAMGAGIRFAGLIVIVNLGFLLLDVEMIPPLPELFAILANGWLLGREYFELAALRHMSSVAAVELRRRNGGRIFVAGTMISLLSSVPVLDLVAPLFGAAFMVHLYNRFLAEERVR